MAEQWHPFQTMVRPALPPPRLTADVYETAGGEAAVTKRRGEDFARARTAVAHNQRLAAAE